VRDSVVQVGVVGLGMGRNHVRALRSLPDARVTAVCDLDAALTARVGEEFGVERRYADYRALCDDPAVDAVVVCVPNALHPAVTTYAMGRGRHVLCEKPIAHRVEDAASMIAAASEAGVTAMMAMKFRYAPAAARVRRAADEGRLGRVYYAATSYLRPMGGIPRPGGWFTRLASSGGGTMIDNGVHQIDMLWWLMGAPRPLRVSAATHAAFRPAHVEERDYNVEDFAAAIIHFEGGAAMTVDNAWACHVPAEVAAARLLGERGGATLWPAFSLTWRDESGDHHADQPPAAPAESPMHRHFVDCIRSGRSPISPLDEGLTVLRIIDAIYRSARTGRPIELETDSPTEMPESHAYAAT